MAKWKPGDAVRVVAREQSAADQKSGLYYNHYANLQGSILKLYGEEVSVLIDRESLPIELRKRHEENEKAMRQRWLDGLSEEGRNRLGTAERNFQLRYAILVAAADLQRAAAPPASALAPRPSAADLDAAEAAYLAQRKRT